MWLMNRTKKLKEFFGIKNGFRYNISFADTSLEVFSEIFPSVMIFPREYHHFTKYFTEYLSFRIHK